MKYEDMIFKLENCMGSVTEHSETKGLYLEKLGLYTDMTAAITKEIEGEVK